MNYSYQDDGFLNSRSLATPSTIVEKQRQEPANKAAEEMSWTEAIQNRGEALGMGLVHGATSYGPEQFYRMLRTVGSWTGSEDLQDWAKEGVDDIVAERKSDPFYKVDPNWVKDEWGRSLYEGASSLASSLETALPGVLAGVATGGVGLGAAFVGSAVIGGGVAGLAEYDSFVDEAHQQLAEINPSITRADVEDDKFWTAIMSGVAEGGFELAGDLVGGKLIGLFGKAGAQPAKHVIQKLLQKTFTTVGTELGSEMGTAYIQDLARQIGGLQHQGAGKAMMSVIGPTLVSAGLGGAGRMVAQEIAGTTKTIEEVRQEAAKKLEDIHKTTSDIAAKKNLGTEAYGMYTKLRASEYSDKNARIIAAQLEAESVKFVEEGKGTEEDYWNTKKAQLGDNVEQGMSSRMALLNTFADPTADLGSAVERSMGYLTEDLSDIEAAAIEAIPEYADPERIKADLVKWITAGRKDPRGLSAEFSAEAKSAFRNMRNKMLDSYGTAKSMKGIQMNPEAVAILDKSLGAGFTTKAAPSPDLYTFTDKNFDEKALWSAVNKSQNPDKAEALVDVLSSTTRLNLDAWNADDPVKAFAGTMDKMLGADWEKKLYSENTDAEIEQRALDDIASEGWSVDAMKELAGSVSGMDLAKQVRKSVMAMKIFARQAHGFAEQYQKTGSMEDMMAARVAAITYGEYNKAYRGLAKDAGTMLRAFNQAGSDRDRGMDKVMRLVEATGGIEANEMFLSALLNADTPEQKKEILKGSIAKTRDHLVEMVMMGLLSNPKTHLVNVLGNGYAMAEEVWNRWLAASMGKDTGVRKGEAGAMVRTAVAGFGEAWKNAKKYFWTQESAFGGFNKGQEVGLTEEHDEASGGISTISDFIWQQFKLRQVPGRALGAADEFFKHLSYNMQVESLKHREAMGATDNPADYHKAIAYMTENLPKNIRDEAMEYTKYTTFQTDMGAVGKGLNKIRNQYPMTRIIMPFLRTPVNIWKWGANRTPGLAKLMGDYQNAMKSEVPAERQLAEARLMTGSLMWSTALTAAAAGFLTGPGPGDAEEKKKLLATGWRPNSLKIGDTYIAMDRLDPAAFILTTAAAVVDATHDLEDEDSDSIHTTMIAASTNALMNRTYLESMADLMEAISDPERNMDWYVRQRATMFIPASGILREERRQQDPVMREVDGIVGQVMNSLPFFSKELPVRRNLLGEPIENENVGAFSRISPFTTSTQKNDPVHDELYRLHKEDALKSGRMSRNVTHGGVKKRLDAKSYSDLQGQAGQGVVLEGNNMKGALELLIANPRYQSLNDEQKGEHAERIIRRYRKAASEKFKKERPEMWLVK